MCLHRNKVGRGIYQTVDNGYLWVGSCREGKLWIDFHSLLRYVSVSFKLFEMRLCYFNNEKNQYTYFQLEKLVDKVLMLT